MTSAAEQPVESPGVERDGRPRLVRIAAFTLERFPPPPQLVLLVVMWLAGVTLLATAGEGVGWYGIHWWRLAASLVGLLLLTFHLRVMDDVKDADHDREHERSRPIPRGLIGEREGDVVWAVLLVLEALAFWYVGPVALALWAITAAYTVLMRLEFFCPAFLDRHVLTFAVSHMLSMGALFALIVACGEAAVRANIAGHVTGRQPFDEVLAGLLEPWLLLAYTAAFCLGMGFELGRKFERYYDAHGFRAWALWFLFPCVGTIVFTYIAREHMATSVELTLAAVAFTAILMHGRTMARRPLPDPPTAAGLEPSVRSRIELLPALFGLFLYLALAIAGVIAVIG